MKALIKQNPVNADSVFENEVILQPFPSFIEGDINYFLDVCHYALCENVPDHPIEMLGIDQRTNVNNYGIVAYIHKEGTRYSANWVWS